VTTTDANGFYQFANLNPGTYVVEFASPAGFTSSPQNQGANDVVDSDANTINGRTNVINLVAGQNDNTQDAGFYQPATIGDFVFEDFNANGIQDAGEPGIGGVVVTLFDGQGNVVSSTNTAVNGFYQFTNLVPGNYQVGFTAPGGFTFVAADQGADDNIDSDANPATGRTIIFNVTGGQTDNSRDAGLFRGGTIGDFVFEDFNANGIQDAGEPGISGVPVILYNSTFTAILGTTTTNGSGFYQFTNLTPGDYAVEFGNVSGFSFTQQNAGVNDATDSDADQTNGRTGTITLVSGQTDNSNDAGLTRPASVGDFAFEDLNGNGIQDAGEQGIPGVTVNLFDELGNFLSTTTTGLTGFYQFGNLTPGLYQLEFVTPSGFDISLQDQGGNDNTDSDVNPATGRTIVFNLNSGQVDNSRDAGYVPRGAIADFVFNDLDKDGVQDAGEPGIGGVIVTLFDQNGNSISSTTTAANGFYQIGNLLAGSYTLNFSNFPAGFAFTQQDQGGNDNLDSDANPQNGNTGIVILTAGQVDLTVDAGAFACDLMVIANSTDITCTNAISQLSANITGTAFNPVFEWSGPNGFNVMGQTATTTMMGTYTVTVTDTLNGCSASNSTTVQTDNSLPDVDAGPAKMITCDSTSVTLIGSSTTPGVTFTWTRNSIVVGNTPSIVVSQTGIYALTVLNPVSGCSATDFTVVLPDSVPISVTASNNGPLDCRTTVVTLTATSANAVSFRWSGPGLPLFNGQTLTTTTAGTYTVIATNSSGCSDTATTVVVQDNTPPVISVTNDGPITCANPTTVARVTAPLGSTFLWTGPTGPISTADTALITVAGSYLVTVTGPNGCINQGFTVVTQNTVLPLVAATNNGPITCTQNSVTLTATGTPGVIYTWRDQNNIPVGTGPQITVNTPGRYFVTASLPTGCEATDSTDVGVDQNTPTVVASNNGPLTCTQTTVNLSASGSTGLTYVWTLGGTVVGTGALITLATPGTYDVTATAPNGCDITSSTVVVRDTASPVVNITGGGTITCNQSTVTLTASGSASVNYLWSGPAPVGGATTAQVTATQAGAYSVLATSTINGCTAQANTTVTVDNNAPVVTVTNDGPLTCVKTSVTLSASSTPAPTFTWNGPGLNNTPGATVSVTQPGTYTVTATAANGCVKQENTIVTETIISLPFR
jgi:hypothetical protein